MASHGPHHRRTRQRSPIETADYLVAVPDRPEAAQSDLKSSRSASLWWRTSAQFPTEQCSTSAHGTGRALDRNPVGRRWPGPRGSTGFPRGESPPSPSGPARIQWPVGGHNEPVRATVVNMLSGQLGARTAVESSILLKTVFRLRIRRASPPAAAVAPGRPRAELRAGLTVLENMLPRRHRRGPLVNRTGLAPPVGRGSRCARSWNGHGATGSSAPRSRCPSLTHRELQA